MNLKLVETESSDSIVSTMAFVGPGLSGSVYDTSTVGQLWKSFKTPLLGSSRGPRCPHRAVFQASLSPHFLRRDLLRLAIAATIGGAVGSTSSVNPAGALTKKRILARAGPPYDLGHGIVARDLTIGKGYEPHYGDTVAIHYSLFYDDLEVESSRESSGLAARPVGFTFGAREGPGAILRGIEYGIEGMRVGGLRIVTVPPEYAYGKRGRPPLIPPQATVDFAISLLSCKRVGTNPNSTINPKSQVF